MRESDRDIGDFQLYSNVEAARVLGVSPVTMKISRSTGVLLGAAAPKFLKMGRVVRYEAPILRDWIRQFRTY